MAPLLALAGPALGALSSAAPILGTAATLVGGGLQFFGGLSQAAEQEAAANYQAKVEEARGKQEAAIAGARARETQRQKRLLQSRQLAVAAKGGGASDPSVVGAIADVEAEAEYRTLTEQAAGQTAQRGAFAQAEQTRRLGKAQARQTRIGAFTSLLETAVTGFDVYRKLQPRGGGGIPSYNPTTSYQFRKA